MKPWITVETFINAPIEKIWVYWTEPEHITQWAFASDDWCAPRASNDLKVGGKFTTRMEAKDGSEGFDFEGIYTNIEKYKKIEYDFSDRKAKVDFIPHEDGYKIIQSFEAEDENSLELQKNGWQTILDNFKKHVEQN